MTPPSLLPFWHSTTCLNPASLGVLGRPDTDDLDRNDPQLVAAAAREHVLNRVRGVPARAAARPRPRVAPELGEQVPGPATDVFCCCAQRTDTSDSPGTGTQWADGAIDADIVSAGGGLPGHCQDTLMLACFVFLSAILRPNAVCRACASYMPCQAVMHVSRSLLCRGWRAPWHRAPPSGLTAPERSILYTLGCPAPRLRMTILFSPHPAVGSRPMTDVDMLVFRCYLGPPLLTTRGLLWYVHTYARSLLTRNLSGTSRGSLSSSTTSSYNLGDSVDYPLFCACTILVPLTLTDT